MTPKHTAIFYSQTETACKSGTAEVRHSLFPAHTEEQTVDAWPQDFHLTQVQTELTWKKGDSESQTHSCFLSTGFACCAVNCPQAREISSWARAAESGTRNGITAFPWKIPPNICTAAGFPKSVISFHWSEWICSQNSCRSVYITHGLIHHGLPEQNNNYLHCLHSSHPQMLINCNSWLKKVAHELLLWSKTLISFKNLNHP